ncbi:MAG: hypothetical protein LBQ48_03400 [Oscillospiraceae bacterium]|jgi:hypothetical protein|nr:hypothetical protein [Oscillospiraceae bacterium]
MISLIIGSKGCGKTKRLINAVNAAADSSIGDVVCIEKGKKLLYDVSHKVRLIDTEVYNIQGFEAFFGFISGICATDYDITDIFVDATLKIGGKDFEAFAGFVEKLAPLSESSGTTITFTVSCEEDEIPAVVFENAQKI